MTDLLILVYFLASAGSSFLPVLYFSGVCVLFSVVLVGFLLGLWVVGLFGVLFFVRIVL